MLKLWVHDNIVYCLKSICINLYMYKVSCTLMLLYLSFGKRFEVPPRCGTVIQGTNSTENKSRVSLLYLYEIREKCKQSDILL